MLPDTTDPASDIHGGIVWPLWFSWLCAPQCSSQACCNSVCEVEHVAKDMGRPEHDERLPEERILSHIGSIPASQQLNFKPPTVKHGELDVQGASLIAGTVAKEDDHGMVCVKPISITKPPTVMVPARPSGNPNRPKDYRWLGELVIGIGQDAARDIGCRDISSGKAMTPLFLLFGGCPNANCPMQAMLFCGDDNLRMDFWWVRPSEQPQALDKETVLSSACHAMLDKDTLHRHTRGPGANDPGPSKRMLQPLVQLFMGAPQCDGWIFGLAPDSSIKDVPRATMERQQAPNRRGTGVLYILFFWQEDWTAVPRAVWKGKLVYQKEPRASQQFARQYEIGNGLVWISEVEEEMHVQSGLPGDSLKQLWEVSRSQHQV